MKSKQINNINLKFNIFGLLLFVIVMLPNIFWFIFPPPNDVLRKESLTPIIDTIASIFQIIMIVCLCFVNKKYAKKYDLLSLICVAIYFLCWILYYFSIVNSVVILGLCIFPCLSFIFYEIRIKNWAAFVATIIFFLLHLIYGIKNFL